MTHQANRPKEGIIKEDAGTIDNEGFIVPEIGELEHVLYFTTVPFLTTKIKEVLDDGRLVTPGAVIVWDETIGRRKGSKAIPKSWWAGDGSLTVAFAFNKLEGLEEQDYIDHLAIATMRTINSFSPNKRLEFRKPNNLYINDLRVGALFHEQHDIVDILIVRINCTTSFTKAPKEIAKIATNVIDYIEIEQLPLKVSSTLTNTLLTRLMDEVPIEFSRF